MSTARNPAWRRNMEADREQTRHSRTADVVSPLTPVLGTRHGFNSICLIQVPDAACGADVLTTTAAHHTLGLRQDAASITSLERESITFNLCSISLEGSLRSQLADIGKNMIDGINDAGFACITPHQPVVS